jgi:hypothetical protein
MLLLGGTAAVAACFQLLIVGIPIDGCLDNAVLCCCGLNLHRARLSIEVLQWHHAVAVSSLPSRGVLIADIGCETLISTVSPTLVVMLDSAACHCRSVLGRFFCHVSELKVLNQFSPRCFSSNFLI